MSKRAIILAGGLGTRLRPYTLVFPKPLMPIGDYPILEVIIRQLVLNGFDHVTLAVNHQAEMFRTFFGNGEKWGVKIDYSLESKPLSTMGPIQLINDLPPNFLVMNGDILTDLSFSGFYDAHVKHGNIFSISSFRREQIIDYGVLEVNPDRILTGFSEKPQWQFEVSMGIYMMSKDALRFIPEDRPYGFDHLMRDILLSDGQKVSVMEHGGMWLDIGRPDDYEEAIDCFSELEKKLLND